MGYLDGTSPELAKTLEVAKANNKKEVVPNPDHTSWVAKDQQLLSYLLNSLTKHALAQVTSVKTSAEEWEALETRFAAHSIARMTNLRMQLTNTKKGNMISTAYFN
jgi:predicted nucleic acid-binding Zn ribbon protein